MKEKTKDRLIGIGMIVFALIAFYSGLKFNEIYEFRLLTTDDVEWIGNEVIDKNTARNAGEANFYILFMKSIFFGGVLFLIISGVIKIK